MICVIIMNNNTMLTHISVYMYKYVCIYIYIYIHTCSILSSAAPACAESTTQNIAL